MNIIPELNLNKTPNTVKNGSIVGAKNIIIDTTGSYITNESGLKVIAQFGLTHEDEKIVGCIPCNDEIVIFTYSEQLKESNIYRHYDADDPNILYHIDSKWEWHGGRIIGDFIYNYKHQLVLVVGEYKDDSTEKIPLLSWVLPEPKITNSGYASEEDTYIDYKIAPYIPPYDCSYDITNEGKLLCGTYTFFIRFEVYDRTYTKWFQITDDIIIYNPVIKEYPQLYAIQNNNDTRHVVATFSPSDSDAIGFYVNENMNSIKNIILNFYISHSKNYTSSDPNSDYKRFQLGYVYRRESETVGRIKGIYNIEYDTVSSVSMFDNSYIEEQSVDEFYKQPIQYYNVKNIKVYNGRCYIANYEEYDNLYKENDDEFNEQIDEFLDGTIFDIDNVEANDIYDDIEKNSSGDSDGDSDGDEDGDGDVDGGDEGDGDGDGEEGGDGEGGDEGDGDEDPVGNYVDLSFTIRYEDANESDVYKFEGLPYDIVDGKKQLRNSGNFIVNSLLNSIEVYYPSDTSNPRDTIPLNVSTTTIYDNEEYVLNLMTQFALDNDNYITICETDLASSFLTGGDRECIIVINDDGSLTFSREDQSKSITLFGGTTTYFDVTYIRYISGGDDRYYNTLGTDGQLAGTWTHDSLPNRDISLSPTITCGVKDYGASTTSALSNTTSVLSDTRAIDNDTSYNYFNRTLLPKQQYKFYFHFIRNDGSVTNGIEFDNVNNSRDSSLIVDDNLVYHIESVLTAFTYDQKALFYPNIKIADSKLTDAIKNEYVGYFISYENLENKVSYAHCYEHNSDNQSYIVNSDHLYNIDSIGNSKVKSLLSSGTEANIESISQYNKAQKERHVIVGNSLPLDANYVLFNDNKDVYLNEFKTLYRLTKNYYFDQEETFDNNFCYLNGYYCNEILFAFSTEIIGSIASTIFKDEEGNDVVFSYRDIIIPNYSFNPYFALSIKTDYEESLNSYVYYPNQASADEEIFGLYLNKSFLPSTLKDFLELDQCYQTQPLISYTNYQERYVTTFPYTIRRSNAFTDESLNNSFAEYEVDEYKNLFENKGQITNIIGYGLKLYIHAEYALYVFDRDNKLTSYTSVNIPDTFDVDYKEVIVKSYGGLQDKYNSIITDFGYIWYDKINNYIFLIDNSTLNILSATINNFIKVLKPNDIRFAEDSKTNRLLICMYYTLSNVDYSLTISYNFNTQTFISLHDYCFKNHYKTKNIDYIYGDNNSPDYHDSADSNIYSNQTLYIFDNEETDYKELQTTNDPLFDVYTDDNISRYIDIVFNTQYEIPKLLESIKYTLNEIVDEFDILTIRNTLEQDLNRRYSGDKLYVYTNETSTGELNINCDDGHNKLNNYKYPYWDKGKWNFNYFRNTVATTTSPTNSDGQSLIYGKYFVIRFIFNNNRRFKLETVEPVINAY